MSSKKAAKPAKAPTFEQAVEQLEQIIEGIEGGELDLEESLDRYEQGIKLLRQCRAVLDRAETRIRQLMIDAEDQIVETDETHERGK